MSNFLIVLFKNKVKKKIINKFITDKKCDDTYKKLIEVSDSVIFPKEYENGVKSKYELTILEKKINSTKDIYVKDNMGRNNKIELDDDEYSIKKILPYNIEELFLDYSTNKKIDSYSFIKSYLPKIGIKMISKLNNKIVVQNDDNLKLFCFKNDYDSSRFIDSLTIYFMSINRGDCIFVKDISTSQRKYLYDMLVEQGFPRNYLLRHSTTHPVKI
jgi:hypothetical protein